MKPFVYVSAADTAGALSEIAAREGAKFIGGGTNLVDLMRESIEAPNALVDINALPLAAIETLDSGVLRIGALARNSDVAANPILRREFPVLSQALLSGASAQLRNMATVGGNVLQRTRCYYFYDGAAKCNKRLPGSGCDALQGFNRIHAILGASEDGAEPSCIATHPSDMCVALAALDAVVVIEGASGERRVALADFHRLPGDTPQIETELRPDELITAVEIPRADFAANSLYRKVRDRASYAFALVSVAAALQTENGAVKQVRIALGGVAHKPWRALEAEKLLLGAPATPENFRAAAEAELRDARGYEHNSFKIELAKRTIVGALTELASSQLATGEKR